jgi:hypothetical protein
MWEKGLKHGQGKEFWEKGGVVYDGEWVNGKKHG